MDTHRKFHQGVTSKGCVGKRCAWCRPKGHKGAPDPKTDRHTYDICRGTQCRHKDIGPHMHLVLRANR